MRSPGGEPEPVREERNASAMSIRPERGYATTNVRHEPDDWRWLRFVTVTAFVLAVGLTVFGVLRSLF
jgi:hypothetical protein